VCGIAGIYSGNDQPIRLEELHSMCNAIAHRGPDDDGFYLTKNVGLGMRRLSIIDLATGRQPIANEDGTIWVVFNGEIYNYKELRKGLEERGHCLATTTDTEIIVHLYEEEGEDCVQQLRGMFAFALWDDRRKKLLLARDRLGIKPLYYAEVGGRLVFASELKAILQLPEVERQLNWGSVNYLFTFLSTPATESIIQEVQKLESGHTLVTGPGMERQIRRYWDVHFEPDREHSEEYFVERLQDLLEESVALHMVSDVPVGAFLSGGIDSASVVATMALLSPARVKTFSIGFTEADYSELKFARMVAKQFSTEHYELVLEPNVLDIVEDLAVCLDEPFGDSSAIPTYMVSKLASQYVKVVLSGDGGDELFAGYDKYKVEEKERNYTRVPASIRKLLGTGAAILPEGMKGRNFLRHLSLPNNERYVDSVSLFQPQQKQNLFQDEAYQMLSTSDPGRIVNELLLKPSGNWLSKLQFLDFRRYLPLDILTKVDRMSMACSLEVRPPLLDHKLVEFAATIPPELLLHNQEGKYIFRAAMKGILPEQILHRPKQGFAIPLGRWFRGKLDSFVRDLLLSQSSRNRGIFRPAYIEKLLSLHKKGRDMDLQLWTLISFELWCRKFLDREPDQTSVMFPQTVPILNLRAS
jgi:asparagine synthase (glutamine-hydrolysing)